MLRSYLGTALWSSNDESDESGGEPLDRNYDISDISDEAKRKSRRDVVDFIRKARRLLTDVSPNMAGHDFWLTRNGHGAGFWDGDYPEPIGEKLTEISETFGEAWMYVGDDGEIYVA
jgi:hypothetical protein